MANQKLPIIDWTSGKIKELPSVEEKKAFENYCKSKGIEELDIDEFYNTLKDFKNKDDTYEVVNDKSIDAIKDNFTPPGAKSKKMEEDDDYKEYEKLVSKNKVTDEDDFRIGELARILGKKFGSFPGGAKIRNDKGITKKRFDSVKLGDIMKSAYPGNSDVKIIKLDPERLSFTGEYTTKDGNTETTRLGVDDFDWSHLEDFADAVDTNDNGKIEKDEMADFQKSLDDYVAKNKKGRDDIPVTTRR